MASKTTRKGKNFDESQESLKASATCPENISGEEKYCQTFTQRGRNSNRPIDILWVIDNSTSMCNNQKKLAQNFDLFIDKFVNQGQDIDFKMSLIGGPLRIKPASFRNSDFGGRMYYIQYGTTLNTSDLKIGKQNFIDKFKTSIKQIGCQGHSYYAESGLVMGLDFLEENQTWPRKDAFLLIIHVSDQYDTGKLVTNSDGSIKLVYNSSHYSYVRDQRMDQLVLSHYIDTLTSHKGSKFLFKIFSVINEANAPRFNQVATLSGGKTYDIFKDSFDTILQDFGEEVAKISSAFQLKYPAQGGTVEVFIDGNLAPQGDWRYLEDENAIRFEEGVFKDKEGKSTIKVIYQTE